MFTVILVNVDGHTGLLGCVWQKSTTSWALEQTGSVNSEMLAFQEKNPSKQCEWAVIQFLGADDPYTTVNARYFQTLKTFVLPWRDSILACSWQGSCSTIMSILIRRPSSMDMLYSMCWMVLDHPPCNFVFPTSRQHRRPTDSGQRGIKAAVVYWILCRGHP